MLHRRIGRRTLLKAGGVALALPMLEAMQPRGASGWGETRRMVSICATLGLYKPSWEPTTTGSDYEATEYLKILDPHRSQYTVLSGLGHEEQQGRQPHNSEITYLTGARHPGMDGFRQSISVDQVMANHLGYATRFPSLTFGSLTPQTQSFTATGVGIPALTSPATAFAAMFLQGSQEEVEREKARLRDGASILDHLLEKRAVLRGSLGVDDNHALDGYFDAVRDAENQLRDVAAWVDWPKPSVADPQPIDESNAGYLIAKIRSWLSLIPLALETDSSRVITLMIQDHGLPPLDAGSVGLDQHGLSHHGQEPEKIKQLRTVESAIVREFKVFLDALSSRTDNNASLLDQTAVLFGSNLGNASSHEARHLPILLAGGGFDHGEHKNFSRDENDGPLSNLFVTLLQRMGVPTDSFGQSDGKLELGGGFGLSPSGRQWQRRTRDPDGFVRPEPVRRRARNSS